MFKLLNIIVYCGLSVLMMGCANRTMPIEKQELSKLTIDDVADIKGLRKFEQSGHTIYFKPNQKSDDTIEKDLRAYCDAKGGKYTHYKDAEINSYVDDIAHDRGFPAKYTCSPYAYSAWNYACIESNRVLFLVDSDKKHIKNPISKTGSYNDDGWSKFIAGSNENKAYIKHLALDCVDKYNKQMKEIAEKEEAQKAEKERLNSMQQRVGTYVMYFFDQYKYKKFYQDEKECSKKCNQKSIGTSGYSSLQEALNNGWEIVSNMGAYEAPIDDYCICMGSKVVMKRDLKKNRNISK